jgi:hypothetical protein
MHGMSDRGRWFDWRVRTGVAILTVVLVGAVLPPGLAQAASPWPTATCGPQVYGGVLGCATVASAGGTTSLVTLYIASTKYEGFEVNSFQILTLTQPTNVVPNLCKSHGTTQNANDVTLFITQCSEKIAPGSSAQVCFDGGGYTGEGVGGNGTPGWAASPEVPNDASSAWPVAAVAKCPVSASSGTGSGAPAASKCVVPNIRGEKASVAERAIVRAGCKVGTLKHVHSTRARNGIVITQSPRAGAKGTKVNLDVGQV